MSGITAADLSNHTDAVLTLFLHWKVRATKGAFDIGMAVTLLVTLLPLTILTLCLLKLLDCGPFLCCQKRVGQGEQPFRRTKFRMMHPDADIRLQELSRANLQMRAQWKISEKLKCAPRVTRLGRLLRRTLPDERPQIIDVLRGGMILVTQDL